MVFNLKLKGTKIVKIITENTPHPFFFHLTYDQITTQLVTEVTVALPLICY